MQTSVQIFLINLDRSPERLENMEQRLVDLPYAWQRVAAVEGAKLPSLDIPEVNNALYEKRHGRLLSAAEVGCYLSHIKALEVFLKSQATYGLILEDDAIPHKQLVNVINALIQNEKNWDIVKLSGFHSGTPLKKLSLTESFTLGIPFSRHCNTAGLFYSRTGAQAAINHLLPMSLPFDHALERPWAIDNVKLRIVTPTPISASDDTASTIVPTKTNRFPWYKRLTTYIFRLKNETQRVIWALKQSFN